MSIVIKNISYSIENKNILENINLRINNNEILTMLGPNGSGKSTLIKLISGDMKPSSGDIIFDKRNINDIKIEERASIRSVMSQSQDIIYDYSVKEIIEMGWVEKMKKNIGRFSKYLEIVSEECKVKHLLKRNFNTLSGGEQRRVHVARTLIQVYNNKNDKLYILLDEPTANLDLFYEIQLIKLMRDQAKKGFGVVMVLHNLNLAYRFSDQILLLENGKVKSVGKPNKVMTEENIRNVYKIPINIKNNNLLIKYNEL